MQKFNKTILDNGLRIITVPKQDSLSTTVLVLVEAGAKYETKDISGISHFFEHMCFKGTAKRPRSIDIAVEFDGLGAQSNAFTGFEYTGYYAKSHPKHFDKILDIISDIYLNSTFDAKEIDKERGVIIEEINMNLDTPMRYIGKLWYELLYGNQPAGRDILGTKETVKAISRDNFLKYKNDHYLAKSTLVVVAGAFNEAEAVEKIKNSFSSIASAEKAQKIKTIEQQESPAVLTHKKESDQTHLILGVRAFDIFDERKYILEVLSDVLGGGMSSRLFQKIREEMGAAYYVGAGASFLTDHGFLAARAGIDHNKIDSVIAAILEEFQKISTKPVEEKELQRVKDHIVGNMFISLETSDDLAEYYGDDEILIKKLITPEEVAQKIQAVTAEEIMAVAQDIFKNNKLNLAVIGPFEDKNRFEKILKL